MNKVTIEKLDETTWTCETHEANGGRAGKVFESADAAILYAAETLGVTAATMSASFGADEDEVEAVEVRPGLVFESPVRGRFVVAHDGSTNFPYHCVPLSFQAKEYEAWGTVTDLSEREVQALIARDGWKLLPGRVEYVESEATPTAADANPMPAIEPGMGLMVDHDLGYHFVAVARVQDDGRLDCWCNNRPTRYSRAVVRTVFDASGNVIWQRRPA